MEINFRHESGPFGDATSRYTVLIPEGTKVLDFITFIVKTYSVHSRNTWGYIEVVANGNACNLLSYDHGRFESKEWCVEIDELFKIMNGISDREILMVKANGGWSRMDYIIYLKEENHEN